MPGRKPLDPAAEADRRIAAMKAKATPVVSCVTNDLPPARLLGECSWLDLYALVLILAEAHDPVKLKIVVQATEDSEPVSLRQVQLRKAHSEVTRRRKAYEVVPPELGDLDRAYHREYNRTRPGRGEVA